MKSEISTLVQPRKAWDELIFSLRFWTYFKNASKLLNMGGSFLIASLLSCKSFYFKRAASKSLSFMLMGRRDGASRPALGILPGRAVKPSIALATTGLTAWESRYYFWVESGAARIYFLLGWLDRETSLDWFTFLGWAALIFPLRRMLSGLVPSFALLLNRRRASEPGIFLILFPLLVIYYRLFKGLLLVEPGLFALLLWRRS